MQSVDGTTSVILTVYDDTEFAIARDVSAFAGQKDGADQLAAKYPSVRRLLISFIEKSSKDTSRAETDSPNWIYLRLHARTTFGTIVAVGGEYLVIDFGGDTPRRTVLPQDSIGRIELDGQGVLRLSTS